MDGTEVIAACKKVLAVQEELIKEMRQEGKATAQEMRKIAEEVKRNSDSVSRASDTLAAPVKAYHEAKSDGNSAYYWLGAFITMLLLCVFGAYFLGRHDREKEFNAAVEFRAKELATEWVQQYKESLPQTKETQPSKAKK